MGIAKLIYPSAPIRYHYSAPLRHRPVTTLHIARPCSSSTILTRRSCTRSLTHPSPPTSRVEGSKLGAGRYEYDYGSCSDAVLPASGGDDDVTIGGGSGGGGDGGGNAGNNDGENMSQSLVVPLLQQLKRKLLGLEETLEILTVQGQIATKLYAKLEKVPFFWNAIGFLTSIPKDAVLRAMGAVFVKENPESTSLGDSSSSSMMDNLQYTSSTDFSSSLAAVSCPMDVDRSNSSDGNDDDESIRSAVSSRHYSFENYAANNMGHWHLHVMRNEATIPRSMDTSSGRNVFEENEKKKGFLAPINSVTLILFTASLALAIAEYAYPFTSKANLSAGDPWMQVIDAGSTIAFIASIILACLGFRLKGRKSIQGAGFQIVKWLILLHPLVLVTVTCIFLHFAQKLSNAAAWSIGAISYIAILFIWAWTYYVYHPEIMEGSRNDSVEDGSFSSSPV